MIVAAPDGGVNLRSGQSTDFAIFVKMIPNDTYLDVFDIVTSDIGREWYAVEYNGTRGFVAASQVRSKEDRK